MTTSPERWLPIAGYESFYEVSDLGRVRSLSRVIRSGKNRTRVIPTRVLKQALDDKGYPQAHLHREGVGKSVKVHVIVARAFIGPRTGPHLRHLDGNPLNNVPSNLRYGTERENAADRVKHGRNVNAQAARTCCKWGHEYSPANTRIRDRGGYSERVCLTCVRERGLERRRRDRLKSRAEKTPERITNG